MTTIVEAVRNYLLTCPILQDLARINVDFLPSDPETYSVEQVPAQPILRYYLDGSTERQFSFVFASRMTYSDELRNNMENSGFFDRFSAWMESNSEQGVLPDLGEGKTPSRIEAVSNAYLFDISGDVQSARYQIQCRLIYDQE